MDAKMQSQRYARNHVGLVGRYFHIWGNAKIERTGQVTAQIDPTRYLVQFYDLFEGSPLTLHVYSLDAMTTDNGTEGTWQFYENAEHWRSDLERQLRHRREQFAEGRSANLAAVDRRKAP